LEAYLLGGCALRYSDHPVSTATTAQSPALLVLLALLITPGHCLPRTALCAILWPREPERHAGKLGAILRQVPALLHAGVEDLPPLQRQGDLVALHPAIEIILDVDSFSCAARAALATEDPRAVRAAAAGYGGPLLPALVEDAWTAGRREARVLTNRHLHWCLALAEQADRMLDGPDQATWLALLEIEHDNLRAALAWCTQEGADLEMGLRLAGTLARFWNLYGDFTEGLRWLEHALAQPAGSKMAAARALALKGAGHYAGG
jgi:DNA-binding SARP family transcriptional activator